MNFFLNYEGISSKYLIDTLTRKKHIEINMRISANPKYHSFVNSLFQKKRLDEKSEEIDFLCPQFLIISFVLYICMCNIN